jgi:penicillin G amidase
MHHEILHSLMIEGILGIPFSEQRHRCFSPKISTGNTLLYGGPQMGYSIPEIVLELGLHPGSVQVQGITFPGAGPYVLIGHGPKHAWTVTSGLSDAVDTYAEKLNPQHLELYQYKGDWIPLEKRTETIEVKSTRRHPPQSVEFDIIRTIHGPVVEWDDEKSLAYSIKRSFWKKEAHITIAFHALNRSDRLQEISRAIKDIPVSFNLVYANSAGDIAYLHLGKHPIRPVGIEDRLPVPGTAEYNGRDLSPLNGCRT